MEHVIPGADGQPTISRLAARHMDALTLSGVLRRLLCDAGVDSDRLGGSVIGPVVRAARDRAGGERKFDLPGAKVTITREAVTVTLSRRDS